MNWIEISAAILFSIDYLWGFTIANDKKSFILNPMSVVDLITILPTIISLLIVIIYLETFQC